MIIVTNFISVRVSTISTSPTTQSMGGALDAMTGLNIRVLGGLMGNCMPKLFISVLFLLRGVSFYLRPELFRM